jgi:hypothetical protein
MVNYLMEHEEIRPPTREVVSVLDKRPVHAKRPLNRTTFALGGPQPRRFEDLPWRTGWRVRRFLMVIWGPSQLDEARDPVRQLVRERTERYAARRAASGAATPPAP